MTRRHGAVLSRDDRGSLPKVDVLTPTQRRYCMSRIRGRDTRPEMCLRRALWQCGLRYRLHASIPGRPDIVFTRAMVAVFVDGCFWHGCPQHAVLPRNNRAFWRQKLLANRRRDRKVNATLSAAGWNVFRIWEHEIRSSAQDIAERIAAAVLATRRSGATALGAVR